MILFLCLKVSVREMIIFKICATAEEMFQENNLEELYKKYQECSEHTVAGNMADFSKVDYYRNYKELEKKGCEFHYILIMDDEKIIGAIIIEIAPQPHFDFKVAFINSIFLMREYRKSGIGKRMIEFVFDYAKKKGAKGCYLTAPCGSRLEQVYNRYFIKTDSLFLKEL